MKRLWWVLLGLVLCVATWPSPARAQQKPLIIGSKVFPESELLADMLAILCKDRGIPVERSRNLNGTLVAFEALRTGAIDVYPEYTGTGLSEILKQPDPHLTPEQVYEAVRDGFARQWRLVWLDPIGFEDTYALAMRLEEAEQKHVKTLSDLVPVAPSLVFGCSHEFLNRQDGYPGLTATYGLKFGDVRGLQHGLAYQALMEKKIDVTDVYTTDGKLDPTQTRILADDKHFFPPYFAAPVVREDALARFSGAREALNALAGRIDDATMQHLNHRCEAEHNTFEQVAIEFLQQQGLTHDTATVSTYTSQTDTIWSLLWKRRVVTWQLTLRHLYLTAVAMGCAVLLGVPLGIWIARYRPAAGAVLGTTGILQTIPSIALLAFMIPYLGIGVKPAIAALFLYALLPIVRNTYAGLHAVDPSLVEVGTGMGLRPPQILWLVELPLAMPVIMAGIRTAAVICIGTATLAAFIGAGGLGDPIATGLTLNNPQLTLTGAIPAALLAIVVDVLLARVEHWVTPRGVRQR